MAKIETVHRCRIDFIWTDACPYNDAETATNRVINKAFKFAAVEGRNAVEVFAFEGNPACAPYVEIESEDWVRVERVAGKVERWIKRLKDVELTN